MSIDVDLLAVVNCLQRDELLRSLIDAAPPQAIVMPFAKERARSYLFVAVFFDNDKLSKEGVLTACKRIVKLLRTKHLPEMDGVEILASVVSAGRTERVVRVSILKESLDAFDRLDNLDLKDRFPASEMTILMYKQIH